MEFSLEELAGTAVLGAIGAVVSAVVGLIAAWSRRAIERRDRRRVMKDRVDLAATRMALISNWIAASNHLGDLVGASEMAHARDELRAAFNEAKAAVTAEERAVPLGTVETTRQEPATRQAGVIRRVLLLEQRKHPASYAIVAAFYYVLVYGWFVGLTIESGNSVQQRGMVGVIWTLVGFVVLGRVLRRFDPRGEDRDNQPVEGGPPAAP